MSFYSKSKQEGELDVKSIFQSFFADFPASGEGENAYIVQGHKLKKWGRGAYVLGTNFCSVCV
jgi:hypothetical protein